MNINNFNLLKSFFTWMDHSGCRQWRSEHTPGTRTPWLCPCSWLKIENIYENSSGTPINIIIELKQRNGWTFWHTLCIYPLITYYPDYWLKTRTKNQMDCIIKDLCLRRELLGEFIGFLCNGLSTAITAAVTLRRTTWHNSNLRDIHEYTNWFLTWWVNGILADDATTSFCQPRTY